ncbi:MAG: 6-carboxytetrahydropterin synthase [Robiginitomaculum sp.]
MKANIILSRTFTFEAAHSLHFKDGTNPGYKHLHGHSFTVALLIKGRFSKVDGWLKDFGSLDPIIEKIRDKLDHSYLNDIEGLTSSSLENLCAYIFKIVENDVTGLHGIEISRKTCGQKCTLIIDG